MGFSIVGFGPYDPAVAVTQRVFTVRPGEIVLAAFMWVDTPSAAGSSGIISGSGDSSTLFALSVAPEAGTYGPGLIRAVTALAGGSTVRVCQAAETFSLVWTPGGAPGAIAPVVRVGILTEAMF